MADVEIVGGPNDGKLVPYTGDVMYEPVRHVARYVHEYQAEGLPEVDPTPVRVYDYDFAGHRYILRGHS